VVGREDDIPVAANENGFVLPDGFVSEFAALVRQSHTGFVQHESAKRHYRRAARAQ
jgi:hypothetical protein